MGAEIAISMTMAEAVKLAGQAKQGYGVVSFVLANFTPEQMKSFNETKWKPGKIVVTKDINGTYPTVEKLNQTGKDSVFLYASDSYGYVEIEVTAKRADVILSWVADTFETSEGNTLAALKTQVLSTSNIKITRQEYDAAVVEQVAEPVTCRRTTCHMHGATNTTQKTVQRFKYILP